MFHWECLNARQSALPSNSPSQSHTCPCCSQAIIPQPNLKSLVADVLRKRISQVNWVNMQIEEPNLPTSSSTATNNQMTRVHQTSIPLENVKYSSVNGTSATENSSQHSVLLMDAFNPQSSNEFSGMLRMSLISEHSSYISYLQQVVGGHSCLGSRL